MFCMVCPCTLSTTEEEFSHRFEAKKKMTKQGRGTSDKKRKMPIKKCQYDDENDGAPSKATSIIRDIHPSTWIIFVSVFLYLLTAHHTHTPTKLFLLSSFGTEQTHPGLINFYYWDVYKLWNDDTISSYYAFFIKYILIIMWWWCSMCRFTWRCHPTNCIICWHVNVSVMSTS